jgi:hypothetical protein
MPLAVSYALNILVVGIPAVRVGPPRWRVVLGGLAVLTILAQVADRICSILAGLLAPAVAHWFHFGREDDLLAAQIAMNFALSGVVVGTLAIYFLRRRWSVARRPAWIIAIAAALVTNPAWAIGFVLWFA